MTKRKPNKAKQYKRLVKDCVTLWSLIVRKKHGGGCAICGESARLNAHHIRPKGNWGGRFDLANGIPLCPKHHKFDRILSAHGNPAAFCAWLEGNQPDYWCYVHEHYADGSVRPTLDELILIHARLVAIAADAKAGEAQP